MSDSSSKKIFASRCSKGFALAFLAAGGFGVGWVTTSAWSFQRGCQNGHPYSFIDSPKLLVQPNELDLGQARPGHSLTGMVVLKNIGWGELQVDRVHAGCACSSLELDGRTLVPGQEVRLTIKAEIHTEGQHLVFPVRISSNDPEAPETIVLVRADAQP